MKALVLMVCLVMSSICSSTEKTVPSFSIRDIFGKQADSREMLARGPMILFFWSTCCGFDKAQVRSLNTLYEKYKAKGLEIVAPNKEGNRVLSKVRNVVKMNNMRFVVAMDSNGELMRKFQIFATPTVILVGRDGTVLYNKTGYNRGDDMLLEQHLASILE